MSGEELKTWMQRTGKNVQDISYALQIHPQTIYRFLQGKSVQRSTRAAIQRLVISQVSVQSEGKIAAG